MFWYYLLLAACVPLAVVPPFFIYNEIYKDGVIGRLGLWGITISAVCVWLFHWFAESGDGLPLALYSMLAASFALFLVWHLFRFHFRVVREQRGKCERRVTA